MSRIFTVLHQGPLRHALRKSNWLVALALLMILPALLTLASCGGGEAVGEAPGGAPPETLNTCLECHSSQPQLMALAVETGPSGEGAAAPPVAAWQRVFLGDAEFVDSLHGQLPCTICHLGDQTAAEMAAAHADMIVDPSAAGPRCTGCHGDHTEIAASSTDSLHTTLDGMKTALVSRGGDPAAAPLSEAFSSHCDSCHSTCGSCHVSRPDSQGGGLVADHVFSSPPSMADNCGGCHGPRVADEYQGNNEGVPADLHWIDLDMPCAACHGEELHGGEAAGIDRYQSGTSVSCRDCHVDTIVATDNEQHNRHLDDFTCQSCHSVEYRNCFNCHVGKDDAGAPYFTIDPSVMMFKIGLNPIRSADRPEKFAVLRHVPVAADTFKYYGDNLLPDFDNSPTWKYATPHNIQLRTPQNASCFACHNNPAFFLASDDILPGERAANQAVTILEPGR